MDGPAHPTVQRDLTGTATGFTAEQIQRAPVEGVRGLMKLTAAIDTNPDGTLSVRRSASGPLEDPEGLGRSLAAEMLAVWAVTELVGRGALLEHVPR